MEFNKLTIHHYEADVKDDRRMTLSPTNIVMVAAEVEDVSLNGRSLRNITVLFMDGNSVDLTINHSDLECLEAAVGAYSFGPSE